MIIGRFKETLSITWKFTCRFVVVVVVVHANNQLQLVCKKCMQEPVAAIVHVVVIVMHLL